MTERRGRPRGFDEETVLARALDLFWSAGYLGTSYADICAATGLTKPSLYTAFGNKEQTFCAALEFYLERYVRPGIEILQAEPNPREAIRKLLIATAEGLTADGTPPGCMIATNAACAAAPNVPEVVSVALNVAAKETPNAIISRLNAASPEQLPAGCEAKAMAAYFETLIAGLSALAKLGTPREELMRTVDTAMLFWAENSSVDR